MAKEIAAAGNETEKAIEEEANNNHPAHPDDKSSDVPVFTTTDILTRGSGDRLAELENDLSRVELDGSRHAKAKWDSITYKIQLLKK